MSLDVRNAWDDIKDPNVKKRVIENIAREHGLDPKDIMWEENLGATKGVWRSPKLYLNKHLLNNPEVLTTVHHELQHRKQEHMMRDLKAMSADEREAVRRGTRPDPFSQYGSNLAEAERLDQNSRAGYKRFDPKDMRTWNPYYYQPQEVDARRAAMEATDGMTPADLDRWKR